MPINFRGVPNVQGTSGATWTRVNPATDSYGWVTGAGGAGTYIPFGSLNRTRCAPYAPVTTLSGSMTNVQTTIPVTAPDGFPPAGGGAYRVLIDSEEMLVTGGQGTNTWTCIRGVNDSNGAGIVTHAAGAKVFGEGTLRIAVFGDSVAQGTVEGNANPWDVQLARGLARHYNLPFIDPINGPGYYGVFRNADAGLGGGAGNSATNWTNAGGTWTLAATGGIIDWAAFGWMLTAAAGAANIIRFQPQPNSGDIKCVDVIYADGSTLTWSYSLDGGTTWLAPATAVGTRGSATLCRTRITSASAITDLRIRAADQPGTTGHAVRIAGVKCYLAAPTIGTTTGVEVWNFAKDLDFLQTYCRTNASGDNFHQLDQTDNAGACFPTLAFVGLFTNDVTIGTWTGGLSSSAAVNYNTRLTQIVTRLKPYCDVILVSPMEQSGRSVIDQMTLRQVIRSVAIANNVACFDIYEAWANDGIAGWAAADAAGLMGTDHNPLHLGPTGQTDVANRLCRMIAGKG